MKIYSKEEAIKKSTEYFGGDELAAEVFVSKYALRNENLELKEATPDQMHRRLAKEFARIEKKYPNSISEEEIFNLFDGFRQLIPQGSPMFGIGNMYQTASISNCFVVDVVDSYGGICRADERIAQIAKRRGGCVEENNFVKVKDRGIIKIKDINVGDQILSYSLKNKKSEYKVVLDKYYTDVAKENRVKITLENGFEIQTATSHPMLVLCDDEYIYKKAGEIKEGDVCIIFEPENICYDELTKFDKKLVDIGWFIGAHTGDGSVGSINKYPVKLTPKKYIGKIIPKKLRIRIVGDNENVVKEFSEICNNILGSKTKYNVSTRKSYKTKCWEYCNANNGLISLVEKYFDNKVGRKCYDCHVFSFIEKNNLWIPYLAGLIDTDGHIKDDGKIDICICAKDVINKLSTVLSAAGIRLIIRERHPKRKNEKTIYRLSITDERFYSVLIPYLRHNLKKETLEYVVKNKRLFSNVYPLTSRESENIISKYNSRRWDRNIIKDKEHTNMMAIVALLKKSNAIGLGGLTVFKEYELLTQDNVTEILQRKKIKRVEIDTEALKYIDILVDGNNNYYAGNKGLINIHNCGLDISPIRPKGMKTKNSALTTDGIVPFMERFSNTAREVAQCIAGGQKVITKFGLKNIEDIIPNKDFVWTKKGWIKVLDLKTNKKTVYKLKTTSGYNISTSEDHIFIIHDGKKIKEVKLRDIKINDNIILLTGTNDIKTKYISLNIDLEYKNINNKPNSCILPKILDEDLAYLLGYSYGDGYVEYNKHGEPRCLELACGHKYPLIEDKLAKIIKKVFSYVPHSRLGGGAVNRLSLSNKCIINFLYKNNLLKQRAEYIVFPEKILKSPQSVQCAFISGYFDADGYASGRKKGYSFSSVNDNFLNTLRVVLISFGILSRTYFEDRSKYGWNNIYSLCVVGSYSKNLFKKFMIYSQKVKMCKHCGKRDNWLVPYIAKDLNVTHNKYKFINNNGFLSINSYNKLIGESVVNNFGGMMVIDNVCSIEKQFITDTYDLVLESEHLFWCEGFYVHNSGRRGALMISISVHHPEVLNFIRAKLDLKKITGANISIRISDEFMEAVKKDKAYEQRWPVDSKNPSISQKVMAREVWDEIVKCGHSSGEPGVLYWDTMIDRGVADCYADVGFKTLSVNPCGELGLGDAGSCILLLQNLTGYIDNPFTKESKLNKELLIKNTRIAQRLIDDMVDLEIEAVTKIIEKIESDKEPEEVKYNELSLWKKVRETTERGRRTGLGITGLGDAIAMLNLKYGSDEAIKVVKEMLEIIRNESYRESTVLAKERGAFSVWDWNKEKDNWFITRLPEDVIKEIKKNGRRNIANLTISPAGSVSVVAQTSSGCEPVYLAEYKRKRKLTENDKDAKPDFIDDMGDKWKEYTVTHHGLKKFKEITGKEFKDSPYFGAQAGDIDYKDRIKTQSMLQKYIDHSISSTINLPNNISVKTVDDIYMMAWEEGCKGITVYRDGSRAGVLTKESSKNKTKDCVDCDEAGEILKDLIEKGLRPSQIIISPAPKRPEILKCEIQRSRVGGGDWLFFVGMLDGQPYEVFGGDATEFEIPHKHKEGWVVKNGKNKEGITQYNLILGSLEDLNEKLQFKGIAKHFNNKEYGAFTRVISLSLRHGVPIKYICSQLIKSGCEGDLFSFQRAMSRILKKYIVDGEKLGGECPVCKSTDMYYKNGCPTCKVCGNSACM